MYQSFYQGSPFVAFALFALLLFIAFFTAVFLWAYLPRRQHRFQDVAQLPLADEDAT